MVAGTAHGHYPKKSVSELISVTSGARLEEREETKSREAEERESEAQMP